MQMRNCIVISILAAVAGRSFSERPHNVPHDDVVPWHHDWLDTFVGHLSITGPHSLKRRLVILSDLRK